MACDTQYIKGETRKVSSPSISLICLSYDRPLLFQLGFYVSVRNQVFSRLHVEIVNPLLEMLERWPVRCPPSENTLFVQVFLLLQTPDQTKNRHVISDQELPNHNILDLTKFRTL